MANTKWFSKLDLSQACQQLVLDVKSQELCTINTHNGLFKVKRMPFGISETSGIFQRTIETVLKNTPNTFVHMDDILVSGKTRKEHDTNLEQVFHKLQTAGFRVKKEKCILAVNQLTFLAHNISDQGISPLQDKVEAILQVPAPTDVTQLQPHLGMIIYYGRFLPNF